MLESLSHIALVVNDPARTASLFHDLFSVQVTERTDDDGTKKHSSNWEAPGLCWSPRPFNART